MAFTVRFSDELLTSFSDDFEFELKDDGILEIVDNSKNRIHYAPHAWISVENETDPAAPGDSAFGDSALGQGPV